MNGTERALLLGLVFIIGVNVVCLYGLVRVLWDEYTRRRKVRSWPVDDYDESLRRALARRGNRP